MAYVEELRALIGHRRINLCGCTVVVENERGELLLQQRVFPEGRWCFPGGLMELGEAAEDTAKRELEEETSLRAQELSLIGVLSGPEHLCRAANGDEYYVVDIAFACRPTATSIMWWISPLPAVPGRASRVSTTVNPCAWRGSGRTLSRSAS